MKDERQTKHGELLQGFMAGELARDEVLAKAPELQQELDELTRLEGLVDLAAEDERAVLAAARAGDESFPAGALRAEEFVAQVASDAPRRRSLRRAWVAAAVLAAASWAAIVLWDRPSTESPERERPGNLVLGRERVALEGPSEGRAGFVVRGLVPAMELPNVRIVVYPEGGPSGAPLGRSPRLIFEAGGAPEVHWIPAPEACEHWPDVVHWEVLSLEPRELLGSSSSRWP